MTDTDPQVRGIHVHRLARLVSSATYGNVLVLAALSVISAIHVSVGYGAELALGVGVATWVAHVYAELLGGHVELQRPMHRSDVTRAMADAGPILLGPILPAAALLLGKFDAVDEGAARNLAILVTIVQLLAIGVFVAKVSPARRSAVWIFAAVTVAIGIAVVGLTTWLGH